MALTHGQRIALTLLALAGLLGPNAAFLYFPATRWDEFWTALAHPIALALLVDAVMATGLLAWYFHRHPAGRYGWKAFVAMSLLGGLGFSVPAFLLLKGRPERPTPDVTPRR